MTNNHDRGLAAMGGQALFEKSDRVIEDGPRQGDWARV